MPFHVLGFLTPELDKVIQALEDERTEVVIAI